MKRLSKEERKRKKYHLWPKRGEFEDTLNCEEEGEEEVEVAAEENIQQLLIFRCASISCFQVVTE